MHNESNHQFPNYKPRERERERETGSINNKLSVKISHIEKSELTCSHP